MFNFEYKASSSYRSFTCPAEGIKINCRSVGGSLKIWNLMIIIFTNEVKLMHVPGIYCNM